nr:MAG TPA: hypothetical protein [Caudoviricetes sp.]
MHSTDTEALRRRLTRFKGVSYIIIPLTKKHKEMFFLPANFFAEL